MSILCWGIENKISNYFNIIQNNLLKKDVENAANFLTLQA